MQVTQLFLELAKLLGRAGARSIRDAERKLRFFVVKLGFKDLTRSGNCVPFVIKKALDAENHLHVAAAIEPLASTPFMGLESGELALPEAENIGGQIAELGDFTDTEVELVRDLGPGGRGRSANWLMLRHAKAPSGRDFRRAASIGQ